jgi:plasmid stability protein
MSLELRPVQVRLPDDAYHELALIAAAQDKDLGEVARELLTRSLMGEAHAIRLAADRLSRAVGAGNMRQGAVGGGK